MKIYSIKLQNFMLFRKSYLEFHDKDIIGVIAESKTDKHSSNRCGKSSLIIDSIRYALTGKSRASTASALIHRGEKEMAVELVLIDGDDKHVIRRGCDDKGNTFIDADSITNSYKAQDYINSLIGMDDNELVLMNFFLQQDIHQFMDMTPTKKKQHLMQWMNNTHWEKLELDANKDLQVLTKNLNDINMEIKLLNAETYNVEDLDSQILDLTTERKRLSSISKQLKVRIEAKRSLSNRLKRVAEDIDSTVLQIDDIGSKMEKYDRLKNSLNKISEKLDQDQDFSARLKRNTFTKKAVSLEFEISDISKKINNYSSLNGLCPILNKSCDRVKPDKKNLNSMKAAKLEAQKRLSSIESKIEYLDELDDKYQKNLELQHRQTFLDKELLELEDYVSPKSRKLYKELRVNLKKLNKRNKKLKAENTTEVSLASLTLDLEQATSDMESKISKISRLEERKYQISLKADKVENLKNSISELQQRIKDQKFLVYMFGKQGIPAQEIENGFDSIESETNYILNKFGVNLSIVFNSDRELKVWEPDCLVCGKSYSKGTKVVECSECGSIRVKKRKDDLNIKVLENGEEYDFNMESGGGKTLVSFSNRLALTRHKQRSVNSNFNVLFLDEPDGTLDYTNKRAFMDILTRTLTTKFGFEQVFWISHDSTIQESIPNVVRVVKFDGYSRTQWL